MIKYYTVKCQRYLNNLKERILCGKSYFCFSKVLSNRYNTNCNDIHNSGQKETSKQEVVVFIMYLLSWVDYIQVFCDPFFFNQRKVIFQGFGRKWKVCASVCVCACVCVRMCVREGKIKFLMGEKQIGTGSKHFVKPIVIFFTGTELNIWDTFLQLEKK